MRQPQPSFISSLYSSVLLTANSPFFPLPLDTPPSPPSHPSRTGNLPASEKAKVKNYCGP